jgi:F0F1-type ATP synthase assembly protein I
MSLVRLASLFCLLLWGVSAEITYDPKHDPEVLIIFFCFGLVLGALMTYVLSRYAENLPYTVVMFLLGAMLSAMVRLTITYLYED